MRTSESTDKIAPAFVDALGAMEDIAKSKANDFGGYNYAPLDKVLEAIRPILRKHHLVIQQDVAGDGSTVLITTRCWHVSGQWLESEPLTLVVEPRKGMTLAQAIGSTITYGRRYALQAFVGITAEEDDDASGEVEQPRRSRGKSREEALDRMEAEGDRPRRSRRDNDIP